MASPSDLLQSEAIYYPQSQAHNTLQAQIAIDQANQQQRQAGQTYQQNLADLLRQYAQRRLSVPRTFIARGVGNGGLYQEGLVNFNAGRQADLSKLALQHQIADQGYGQTVYQAKQLRDQANAQLAEQRNALLADKATIYDLANQGFTFQ